MAATSQIIKNSNLPCSNFRSFHEITNFNQVGRTTDPTAYTKPDHMILHGCSPNVEKHFILFNIVQQKGFPFSVLIVCIDTEDREEWGNVLQFAFGGLSEKEQEKIFSYFELIELERAVSQYPLAQKIDQFSNLQSLILTMLQGKETAETCHFKDTLEENSPTECHTELFEFGFVASPLCLIEPEEGGSIYSDTYELVVSCGPTPCFLVSLFALNAICRRKLWLLPPSPSLGDVEMKFMWTLLMHMSTREHTRYRIDAVNCGEQMFIGLFKAFRVIDISEIKEPEHPVIMENPVILRDISSIETPPTEEVKRRRCFKKNYVETTFQYQQFVVGWFMKKPGSLIIPLDFTPDYKPLYQGYKVEGTRIEVLVLNSGSLSTEHKAFMVHHLLRQQPAKNLVIFDYHSRVRASLSTQPFTVVSSRDYYDYFNRETWKTHSFMIPFPEDLKHLQDFSMTEFLTEVSAVTFLSFVNDSEESYLLWSLNNKLLNFFPQLSRYQGKLDQHYNLQHASFLINRFSNPTNMHAPIQKNTLLFSMNRSNAHFATGQSFGVHLMASFFEALQKRFVLQSRYFYDRHPTFRKNTKESYLTTISRLGFSQELERQFNAIGRQQLYKIRDLQYYGLRYMFSKKQNNSILDPGTANQLILKGFPLTHADFFRVYKPPLFKLSICIRISKQDIVDAKFSTVFPAFSLPAVEEKTEVIFSKIPLNPKMLLTVFALKAHDPYFSLEDVEYPSEWKKSQSPKITSMMVLVRILNPFFARACISENYDEGLLITKQGNTYAVIGMRGQYGLLKLQEFIYKILQIKKRAQFTCFPQKYVEFFKRDLARFSFIIETYPCQSIYLKYMGGRVIAVIKPR